MTRRQKPLLLLVPAFIVLTTAAFRSPGSPTGGYEPVVAWNPVAPPDVSPQFLPTATMPGDDDAFNMAMPVRSVDRVVAEFQVVDKMGQTVQTDPSYVIWPSSLTAPIGSHVGHYMVLATGQQTGSLNIGVKVAPGHTVTIHMLIDKIYDENGQELSSGLWCGGVDQAPTSP